MCRKFLIDLNMVWSTSKIFLYKNLKSSSNSLAHRNGSKKRCIRFNGICSLVENTIKLQIQEAYPITHNIFKRVISILRGFRGRLRCCPQEGIEFGRGELQLYSARRYFIVGSIISKEGKFDASHRRKSGFVQNVIRCFCYQIPDYL